MSCWSDYHFCSCHLWPVISGFTDCQNVNCRTWERKGSWSLWAQDICPQSDTSMILQFLFTWIHFDTGRDIIYPLQWWNWTDIWSLCPEEELVFCNCLRSCPDVFLPFVGYKTASYRIALVGNWNKLVLSSAFFAIFSRVYLTGWFLGDQF